MSKISVGQRFSLLAKLGENVDWDSLTTEQVQVGIREAHTFAAKEFEALIRNGFRVQVGDFFREMEKVAIQIPALPRPTLTELQGAFPWIRSVERDTSPTEAVTLCLGTVLLTDEGSIGGAEYERRLASVAGLLGYQQLRWLVDHQDEHPDFQALLGRIYIDGPGIIVVDAYGDRDCPDLSQGDRHWDLHWGCLEYGLSSCGRIAVSGK